MRQLNGKIKGTSVVDNSKSTNSNSESVFKAPCRNKHYEGNIENFIGLTQVPTGLIEALKIKGANADGTFKVPLATTEGALVASFNRGATAITAAGGASVIITNECLQRCPAFRFENIREAQRFINFVEQAKPHFQSLVETQSKHAKLLQVDTLLLGNLVILTFWYNTGDAAGQNMVSFCTEAICQHLIAKTPVSIRNWYIESNLSGDKKASANNMSQQRGKRIVAEVILSKEIVASVLKSSPQAMVQYHQCAVQACLHTGTIGVQGHFANGLAALFLATGNDVACVAESACGITQVAITEEGQLHATVVIPAFTAGTVGGGTSLPTQQAALQLMGCAGTGKSRKFAEIAAGLVLAGELSIMAALAEGHFTSAHKSLGR